MVIKKLPESDIHQGYRAGKVKSCGKQSKMVAL